MLNRHLLTLFAAVTMSAFCLPAVVHAQPADQGEGIGVSDTLAGEEEMEDMSPEDMADSDQADQSWLTSGWGALPGLREGVFAGGDGAELMTSGDFDLEGLDLQLPSGEVPSGFGLWWRGVKENVSLAFTFNAERKAEKRLQYAEERMRMADALADKADDPKVQKRIEKLVGKAHKFMDKMEKDKDKWFDKSSERAQRLVSNITRHHFNRETVMDNLEDQLPEDSLNEIRTMREEGLESSKRLLNAIANEDIPGAVRSHLQGVKEQIEKHAEDVKQYREQKTELLERRKAGDEAASGELEMLRGKRHEQVKDRVQQRKDIRDQGAKLRPSGEDPEDTN